MFNLAGQSLGRYHLIEKLGEGGMGLFFGLMTRRLERFVAIKVILPDLQQDTDFSRRFDTEAKALASPIAPQHCTNL